MKRAGWIASLVLGSILLGQTAAGQEERAMETTITIIERGDDGHVTKQQFTTSDPNEIDRLVKKYSQLQDPNIELRIKTHKLAEAGPCEDDKGFLGVYLVPQEKFDGGKVSGAQIEKVVEGSAAHLKGLQKGDLIIKVNGQEVNQVEDLLNTLKDHKQGEIVKLHVLRDGKKQKFEIVLGACESMSTALNLPNDPFDSDAFMHWNDSNWTKLSFELDSLLHFGAQAMEPQPYLGISSKKEADLDTAIVGEVVENTAAEAMGLQAEDHITHLNGMPVSSFQELALLIKEMKPQDDINIIVMREGAQKVLSGKLGERMRPNSEALFIAPGMKGSDENGILNFDFHIQPDNDSLWNNFHPDFPKDLFKLSKQFEITMDDLSEKEMHALNTKNGSTDNWETRVEITPLQDAQMLMLSMSCDADEEYTIIWSKADGTQIQKAQKHTAHDELHTVVDLGEVSDQDFLLTVLKGNTAFYQKIKVKR